MPNPNLNLQGMTAEEVFNKVTQAGVSASDAGILVGSWIYQNFGSTQRVFNYTTQFAPSDPSCAPTFNRTFVHTDWLDGQSVVQAEQTTGEEGFNTRFHHIEKDLDQLSADIARLYNCIGEVRKEMAQILDELRAEINRINTDVFNLQQQGTISPVHTIPNFGGLVANNKFLGVSKLDNVQMSMWQTPQGLMMLPAAQTINIGPTTLGRLSGPSGLARYIAENPQIGQLFTKGPVTKEALLQQVGDATTSDGQPLKDILAVLPANSSYSSSDALVNDVAERQAAVLRTTQSKDATLAAAFGVNTTVTNASDAPIDQLQMIDADTKATLIKQGIDTVGKLQATPASQLATILAKPGQSPASGQAAELGTLAKTLTSLH